LCGECLEIITRNIAEKAILCAFIYSNRKTNSVDRYLKKMSAEYEKSFEEDFYKEEKRLPVKNLPDYAEMSKCLDKETYITFKKLSFLSHPKNKLPYSLEEYEYTTSQNTSKENFYNLRSGNMLKVATQALSIIRDRFEKSDAEWVL